MKFNILVIKISSVRFKISYHTWTSTLHMCIKKFDDQENGCDTIMTLTVPKCTLYVMNAFYIQCLEESENAHIYYRFAKNVYEENVCLKLYSLI